MVYASFTAGVQRVPKYGGQSMLYINIDIYKLAPKDSLMEIGVIFLVSTFLYACI